MYNVFRPTDIDPLTTYHPLQHSSYYLPMQVKNIAKTGGEAVVALLRLTHTSSEVFPPLRSATGLALNIVDTVAKFKSNEKDWGAFGEYVQDALTYIIVSLPDTSQPREDLKRNVEKLRDVLNSIGRDVQALQKKSGLERYWSFTKSPEMIQNFRQQLGDALSLFQLGSTLITSVDLAKVVDSVDINKHLQQIITKLSDKIGHSLVLNTLPYAEGASWDPSCVCLENTRVNLLKDITNWINQVNASQTTKIFWLSDVAGAGKSAVAHTVAQHCDQTGILASSFFFDQNVEGRNGSKRLFSTIARDLANFDMGLSDQISLAIENDRSLPTAPILRQFEKLILGPSKQYTSDRPIVIVIDALDEGLDTIILQILSDEVPKLPGTFRIFLTSRSEDEIEFYLSGRSHIHCQHVDIRGHDNKEDIASYVKFKLQGIAERKKLHSTWPGLDLMKEFITKSDGLFIWVSIISDFLRTSNNPDRQLKVFLSEYKVSNRLEAKMDNLYLSILKDCPWDDEDFVEAYSLLMGTITVVKTPVLLPTLQVWYPTLQDRIHNTLGQLGSLLTGWNTKETPIQIIHISFQDFLMVRALSSVDSMKFYINETDHNHRIALCCINTMNNHFKEGLPGTGYIDRLTVDLHDIPNTINNDISEALWYACKFWISHVIAIEVPEPKLVIAVKEFISLHLISWVELVTSRGKFQKLNTMRTWLLKTLPGAHDLMRSISTPYLAKSLKLLTSSLVYWGRLDEAIQAGEEAVDLHRKLFINSPQTFKSGLAASLNNLSLSLIALGDKHAALCKIEEAVEFHIQLAIANPAAEADLALSLNNLSICQAALGDRDKACQTIEEAIRIFYPLAKNDPIAFKSELAKCLNTQAVHLLDLGCLEETRPIAEEAVRLYQELYCANPLNFKLELATCLQNLCTTLRGVSITESLKTSNEAVKLFEELVLDQPTVFASEFANALNTHATIQYQFGQVEESYKTTKKAIDIYRQLIAVRSSVFNHNLALCLNNLSIRFSALNLPAKALQAVEESIKILNLLNKDNSNIFKADLAISLHTFSAVLSELGHSKEALEKINQAISLWKDLDPLVSKPDLAMAMNTLSNRHSTLGNLKEALEASKISTKLYKDLVIAHPSITAYKNDLAMSLNTLSTGQAILGHLNDACQTSEEAIMIDRNLIAEHPNIIIYIYRLAASLNSYYIHLSNSGHRVQASKAIKESVTLHEQLALDNPIAFTDDLAMSINNLSIDLQSTQCFEEALVASKKAVRLYQKLVQYYPSIIKYRSGLASTLIALSSSMYCLGQKKEAFETNNISVILFRNLEANNTGEFQSQLAMSLSNLSLKLSAVSRLHDALDAIKEAVELRQQLAMNNPITFNPKLKISLNFLLKYLSDLGYMEEVPKVQEELAKLS